jgi:hypothetical protein
MDLDVLRATQWSRLGIVLSRWTRYSHVIFRACLRYFRCKVTQRTLTECDRTPDYTASPFELFARALADKKRFERTPMAVYQPVCRQATFLTRAGPSGPSFLRSFSVASIAWMRVS